MELLRLCQLLGWFFLRGRTVEQVPDPVLGEGQPFRRDGPQVFGFNSVLGCNTFEVLRPEDSDVGHRSVDRPVTAVMSEAERTYRMEPARCETSTLTPGSLSPRQAAKPLTSVPFHSWLPSTRMAFCRQGVSRMWTLSRQREDTGHGGERIRGGSTAEHGRPAKCGKCCMLSQASKMGPKHTGENARGTDLSFLAHKKHQNK